MTIKIGTRGSALALWQAEYVAGLIGKDKTEIVIIKTQGDRIQNVSFDKMEGKGFFTKEIEESLLTGEIDLAVHSLKDLSTDEISGLKLAAIPVREDPSDVMIIRREYYDPDEILRIKKNSTVGTSSMRRLAQLKCIDSSLEIKALRGNVNTRLRKLSEAQYNAIVLAGAGLKRLELEPDDFEIYPLPDDLFIPAPGQGALGLQIRSDDQETFAAVVSLNDEMTERRVVAERSFLKHFGGGCHIPLGAHAVNTADGVELTGIIASPDGSEFFRETISGKDPVETGARLALILKEKGADRLL